jgi:colanic acid/amylovoran biosynthesis glycosyltransferase
MNRIAYLANSFPEAVEPYVWEEIRELRSRGKPVLPCSFRRPRQVAPQVAAMASETTYIFPIDPRLALHACWIFFSRLALIGDLLWRAVRGPEPIQRKSRTLVHTWLGVYLATALRNKQITHIHIHHGYFSSWAGMVAARLLGAPFSLTLHGSDLLVRADYLDCKLKHCKFCITVSDFNRRHIRKHYADVDPRKILVHRLGVDLEFWTSTQIAPRTSCFSILTVGRLHPIKNYDFLVQACYELRNAGLKIHCTIAGEGPEREHLKNYVRELDLENTVEFCGHVGCDRLRILYTQADVVVLTSRSEGIRQTLMEAMAMERVVLAPAITGIPELISDKQTGFLYRQGSLPDFLNKLTNIAAVNPSFQHIGQQARQHVQLNFNRQQNLDTWAADFVRHLECSPEKQESCHANPVLQQVQLPVQRDRSIPV